MVPHSKIFGAQFGGKTFQTHFFQMNRGGLTALCPCFHAAPSLSRETYAGDLIERVCPASTERHEMVVIIAGRFWVGRSSAFISAYTLYTLVSQFSFQLFRIGLEDLFGLEDSFASCTHIRCHPYLQHISFLKQGFHI